MALGKFLSVQIRMIIICNVCFMALGKFLSVQIRMIITCNVCSVALGKVHACFLNPG